MVTLSTLLFEKNYCRQIVNATRLHSSRMHTARTLTISHSILCARGLSASWGVCLVLGVSASGGCLLLRGCAWSWGVCLVLGGVPAQFWERLLRHSPLREQNSWHTPMKILPYPKLCLRAVIMKAGFANGNSFGFFRIDFCRICRILFLVIIIFKIT